MPGSIQDGVTKDQGLPTIHEVILETVLVLVLGREEFELGARTPLSTL